MNYPTAGQRGLAALNIVTFAPGGLEMLLGGEMDVETLSKLVGVKPKSYRGSQAKECPSQLGIRYV